METIAGVRDFKHKFSHYLREVKKGRSIVIMERGKVVAKIIPAQEHRDVKKLKRLTRERSRDLEGRKTKGASRSVVVKGKPVGDIVLEEPR